MSKKNARNYDNGFKNNAIHLCLKSGRQINEIALELGIVI